MRVRNLRILAMAIGLVVVGAVAGGGMVVAYRQLAPKQADAVVYQKPVMATDSQILRPADGEGAAAVYRRAAGAVVNVTSRTTAESFFGEQMPEQGTGSGVIIDNQGYILTNNHVVAEADSLEVTLADGSKTPARVVGRDSGNDLAVIKVNLPPDKLTVATLGTSKALQVGEPVLAIGNPFGLDQTVTHGIVSATGRRLERSGARSLANLIQTDAPINPGNSGGPLLNLRGEVVGINTAIENPTGQAVFVGVGFAVPIDTAKRFLPAMLAGTTVEHAWLGVSGLEITPERAKSLGLSTEQGILIVEAVPNGPAAAAGLRGAEAASRGRRLPGQSSPPVDAPTGGDVVTSIDGRAVRKVEDLADYVDTKNVGDGVALTIVRGGQQQTLSVRLGAWPNETTE